MSGLGREQYFTHGHNLEPNGEAAVESFPKIHKAYRNAIKVALLTLTQPETTSPGSPGCAWGACFGAASGHSQSLPLHSLTSDFA